MDDSEERALRDIERTALKTELDYYVTHRDYSRRGVRGVRRAAVVDLVLASLYGMIALSYIVTISLGLLPLWHLINASIWLLGFAFFGLAAKKNQRAMEPHQRSVDLLTELIREKAERYEQLK